MFSMHLPDAAHMFKKQLDTQVYTIHNTQLKKDITPLHHHTVIWAASGKAQ